jgi:two-component system LytT family sensor kinase
VTHCILELAGLSWRTIAGMDETPTGARSTRWLRIAVIWCGVGLIDAGSVCAMHAPGAHYAWLKLTVTLVLSWLPWALATPFVLDLGRRYPPFRLTNLRVICIHVSTVAAIGIIFVTWSALLEIVLNPLAEPRPPGPFTDQWRSRIYLRLVISLIVYALMMTITFVMESKQRIARQQTEAARLNEQLSKAELSALRRQMEPHFMFNTLNAIAGLIRDNRSDAAISMIVGLSEFLRRAADDSNRPQVTLVEEVEYLQRYLDIQKVRFAERLQVSVDVPPELLPLQVPNLILQPLVENAIKHGIAKRAEGGAIRVTASHCNGYLSLRVYNDGPCLPADWATTRGGIGLSNLRTRLQILFGAGFELNLRNPDTGGVEVLVSLPVGKA